MNFKKKSIKTCNILIKNIIYKKIIFIKKLKIEEGELMEKSIINNQKRLFKIKERSKKLKKIKYQAINLNGKIVNIKSGITDTIINFKGIIKSLTTIIMICFWLALVSSTMYDMNYNLYFIESFYLKFSFVMLLSFFSLIFLIKIMSYLYDKIEIIYTIKKKPYIEKKEMLKESRRLEKVGIEKSKLEEEEFLIYKAIENFKNKKGFDLLNYKENLVKEILITKEKESAYLRSELLNVGSNVCEELESIKNME